MCKWFILKFHLSFFPFKILRFGYSHYRLHIIDFRKHSVHFRKSCVFYYFLLHSLFACVDPSNAASKSNNPFVSSINLSSTSLYPISLHAFVIENVFVGTISFSLCHLFWSRKWFQMCTSAAITSHFSFSE